MSQRALAVVVAAVVLGGGVAAASQLLGSDARSAADRAIAAGRAEASNQSACKPQAPDKAPRLVSDPVPPDVAERLEIFRRAREPGDKLAARHLGFAGAHVLAASIRVARAGDGTRFAMYISYGRLNLARNYSLGSINGADCLRAALAAALAQPQAKDSGVRAEITAKLGKEISYAQALIDGTAHYLTVMGIDPHGRLLGGGGTILHDGKIPAFASIGSARRGRTRVVEVSGLVPDGVRDVRITDSSGPQRQRVGAHVVTVRDNVYHAVLPRLTGPKITVQWRSGHGDAIRTTHLSY